MLVSVWVGVCVYVCVCVCVCVLWCAIPFFPLQVLLQCMSAVSVYSTEAGLVAVVTELIGRLVAIPSQVCIHTLLSTDK